MGNVEVAALSGEVTSVVESEARRDSWRQILKEDTRKTQEALKKMQDAWEKAVDRTIPEDLHESLCQLRG